MTKIRFILMVVVVGLFAVGCDSRVNPTVSYMEKVDFNLKDGTSCHVFVSPVKDLENHNLMEVYCNWKGN